jgi:hypothetical protein
MNVPIYCRFCNAENSIDQMGDVRVSAWRKVESVTADPGGKLTPKVGHVEHDYADDHDFDADGYRCCECQREERRLEDLVGDPIVFEPGARVICPDGFRGVIATVDLERRTLTVDGWHETFKFSEVSALIPVTA